MDVSSSLAASCNLPPQSMRNRKIRFPNIQNQWNVHISTCNSSSNGILRNCVDKLIWIKEIPSDNMFTVAYMIIKEAIKGEDSFSIQVRNCTLQRLMKDPLCDPLADRFDAK